MKFLTFAFVINFILVCWPKFDIITLCVINVHVHMKIKSFSSRCKQSYVYIEYFLLVYLV